MWPPLLTKRVLSIRGHNHSSPVFGAQRCQLKPCWLPLAIGQPIPIGLFRHLCVSGLALDNACDEQSKDSSRSLHFPTQVGCPGTGTGIVLVFGVVVRRATPSEEGSLQENSDSFVAQV
eukprot:4262786-Amphidinium_carterae.1